MKTLQSVDLFPSGWWRLLGADWDFKGLGLRACSQASFPAASLAVISSVHPGTIPHPSLLFSWGFPRALTLMPGKIEAGKEGDDRGWDGWLVSPTKWTWAWASSGSWWWTGTPGVLQSLGSQRVGHDWATELNWWAWEGCPLLEDGNEEAPLDLSFPPAAGSQALLVSGVWYYVNLLHHNSFPAFLTSLPD